MSTHNVVWLAPEQLAEIKAAYATPTIEPIAVSAEHAAILLDCSPDTVRTLVNDGRLKAFNINSLVRIKMSSIKKFVGA